MAKREVKKITRKRVVATPADIVSVADTMFNAARQVAKTQFGTGVLVGDPSEVSEVGLPLPALSLRYLLQSTVAPLGRVWQLAGEEGSCKSTMLYEILRWHMLYNGGGCLFENENKDATTLRNAVLSHREDWIRNRLYVAPTNSLEEWQAGLTKQFKAFQTQMDAKNGPGRTIPICLGVDSLTATDTQANIDKIAKEGFASRGYSEVANLISRFMRGGLVHNMREYPFTVVGTNHLKPATDAMGRPKANVPGGKAVPFMATIMLEQRRIDDIDLEGHAGIRVKLTAQKNSVGPSRKWIEAEFLWWFEPCTQPDGTPGFRQQAFWDWDSATVEMLLNFETRLKGKKTLFKDIVGITGLRAERSLKRASSDVLGVEGVSYREWGRALEQRPDLLKQLYPILQIIQYPEFIPGTDFRKTLKEASHVATAVAAKMYENTGVGEPLDSLAPPEGFEPEEE